MAGSCTVNTDSTNIISLYEGLSARIKGDHLIYAKGGTVLHTSDEEINEAVAVAKKADIAGESETLKFIINKQKLSFYNRDLNCIIEPEFFQLMIGTASNAIKLKGKFELN